MPLNSMIKTRLEEVARPVWVLGADGEPAGDVANPLHVTGALEIASEGGDVWYAVNGVVADAAGSVCAVALRGGWRQHDGRSFASHPACACGAAAVAAAAKTTARLIYPPK